MGEQRITHFISATTRARVYTHTSIDSEHNPKQKKYPPFVAYLVLYVMAKNDLKSLRGLPTPYIYKQQWCATNCNISRWTWIAFTISFYITICFFLFDIDLKRAHIEQNKLQLFPFLTYFQLKLAI